MRSEFPGNQVHFKTNRQLRFSAASLPLSSFSTRGEAYVDSSLKKPRVRGGFRVQMEPMVAERIARSAGGEGMKRRRSKLRS